MENVPMEKTVRTVRIAPSNNP
ncbi:MAG: hypothetical protein RLZZ595_476, partial [Bacteroidota bacterium]